MANESWNETQTTPPGWKPGYGVETGRDRALVDVDYTDQRNIDYADQRRGFRTERPLALRATSKTAKMRRHPERQMIGDGQERIEYGDDKPLRKAEWDDRKEAYEREAERRQWLQREQARDASRETTRQRDEIERNEAMRRRRTLPHSVRREETSTLISDFFTEAQTLAREEMQLAKAEMVHEVKGAGKAAGGIGVGGVLAFVGLLALVTAAIVALAAAIPLWLSAFLIGAVVLLVGGIMAMGGMSKLRSFNPKPDRTTETLKEDGQWASGLMRDVKSRRRAHA